MKAIDVVKIMAFGMELLSKVDIKTEDYKHISLYEDYCKMRSEGHKYEYAVAVLSKRYKISRSSVSRQIRKLGKDCQNMTLNKM